MTIKEFAELVRIALEERTGGNVEYVEVRKNNGVILNGIVIKKTPGNVMATIYVEQFYEKYKTDNDLEWVLNRILELYEKNQVLEHVDMSFMFDFNKIKNKIVFRLVNYNANKELLKEVPFISFLDLAKVFYVEIENEQFGKGSIMIRNNFMDIWNVDVEALEKYARLNTALMYPLVCTDLYSIILQTIFDMGEYELLEEMQQERKNNHMYVLSNNERTYGAAALCYKYAIKSCAERVESDLYIFPSSIHEVLLWPAKYGEDIEDMKKMVTEINRTQVEREEVLSDSVYVYRRKTEELTIC